MDENVNKLREARSKINPLETYRMRLPDGRIQEISGAELIATAEAQVSVFDAIERGESPEVIRAAFDRLDRTME